MNQIVIFALILMGLLAEHSIDAQSCNCDLTGGVCNIACCCDPDCTTTDRNVFQCSNSTLNSDSLYCSTELVFANALPSTSSVQKQNGVLCIVTDNYAQRNFYTSPDVVTNETDFDPVLASYPTITYDVLPPTQSSSAGSFYVSGDTVEIYKDNVTQDFILPSQGPSNMCIDGDVEFLVDQKSSCSRKVNSVTCTAGSYFDSNLYLSFQVYQIPSANTTSPVLLDVTTCDSSAVLLPSFVGNQCENAVSSVTYTITYNGTNGIVDVCADIRTTNTMSSLASQIFTVEYISLTTNGTIPDDRSGNPGYLPGKPLRTALLNGTTGTDVYTLTPNLLTLLNSETDNLCASSRTEIQFLNDQFSGCVVNVVSTTTCETLQAQICDVLIQSQANLDSTVVGTYGNIAEDNSTDWIPVLTSESLLCNTGSPNAVTAPAGCPQLIVGMNYEVLYAYTGAIYNPQAKIVGIKYSFSKISQYKFQCRGLTCPDQKLELSTSVTFIDASTAPVSVLRLHPIIYITLPEDFFYPFTSQP